MDWSRSRTLLLHNWRLLIADPAPIVLTTLMPIGMMAFLQGTGRAVLRQSGFASANGAELVVPGMAVMFAFFGVAFIGTAFFTEHEWGTWERLRASRAGSLEIIMAKILPPAALMLGQLIVLFIVGALLFGLQVHGSVAGVGVMMVASICLLVALSMLFVAISRTVNQLSAMVQMAAMVLPGLGGALAPVDVLPEWARVIAPASPAYWMLQGFRAVVLEGRGLDATIGPAAITLAFSAVAAAIAIRKFRVTDEKVWDL
jgi:ABC-2 type transport system permease protein